MRASLHFLALTVAVSSVMAFPRGMENGGLENTERRGLHRAIIERQRPNMNDTISAPPSSFLSTTITSSESRPSSVSSTVSSSSSSSPSPSAVQTTSSVPPSSSSQTTAAPSSASSSDAPSSVISTASSSDPISQSGVVPTISVPSSAPSQTAISTYTSTLRQTASSVTTRTTTSSASVSAGANNADSGNQGGGGLSKTALIAIIVVSSVVGLAAIGWTLFRKYKLKPSSRFERRLNAIDFSPNGGQRDDDYFEKAHSRHGSSDSAERHRKALVAEEFDGPANLVPGVPEHDFTAGPGYATTGGAGAGGAYGMYNSDPFAHTQSYDYDQTYAHSHNHGYPPHSYDQYGNPIYTGTTSPPVGGYDYPTQDGQEHAGGAGYADLQRGNSTGSGGHAHGHVHSPIATAQTGYNDDFPESGQYLGRPTGGADGPYAQAAQYRTY